MSATSRAVLVATTVLISAVLAALGTYQLVLKMALEHQTASPELRMAAAMGGLFSSGLVAVLVLLCLLRVGSKKG